MREFTVYLDADKHGRIDSEQRQKLRQIINSLENERVNLFWIIRNTKIPLISIFIIFSSIHNTCRDKSIVIHNSIFTSEKHVSKMTHRLMKALMIESCEDNRIAVDDIECIILDNDTKGCFFSSCLGNTVFLKKNGELSICPFELGVSLCKTDLDGSLNTLYETESFKELLISHIYKRDRCKEICDWYSSCKGGCPLDTSVGEECDLKRAIETKDVLATVEEENKQRIHKLANLYRN